jgi:hypothetical protein
MTLLCIRANQKTDDSNRSKLRLPWLIQHPFHTDVALKASRTLPNI